MIRAASVTFPVPSAVKTMLADASPTDACGMRCLSRSIACCDSVPGIEGVDAIDLASVTAPTPRKHQHGDPDGEDQAAAAVGKTS